MVVHILPGNIQSTQVSEKLNTIMYLLFFLRSSIFFTILIQSVFVLFFKSMLRDKATELKCSKNPRSTCSET